VFDILNYLYLLIRLMTEVEIKTISEQKILWIRVTATTKIIIYLIPLFFIPFLLGGPQLLVGSVVNLLLIFIALNYKNYAMIIPMVMLPSIAACLNWLIFGSFTIFLVYMMPAIRLGNFILVYAIQHIKTQRLWILIWWILKTLFLFVVAYILIKLWILPAIFLKAMGVMQLVTVMIAGAVAFSFIRLSK